LAERYLPLINEHFFSPFFFFSSQLKSLLQRSVEEFVNLFDPSNRHRSPVFALALTLDDEKMEMYPDLEACVLEILDVIANTLQVSLTRERKTITARGFDHSALIYIYIYIYIYR